MSYKRRVFTLIFIATILRLILAASIELGNDEVYYWTYPLHLQMNYFDHPPLIALLLRITTFNLLFDQEIFLRLGSIICAAIGTWLSFSIGKKIKNERTGWFAAILYNTSIYSSVIAGLFILPDSPQILFWLLSINIALSFTNSGSGKRVSMNIWILWGLFAGLCIMCKVHGVFLWLGLGLYILLYQRNLLSDKGLYISILISLLIISPIFIWNWQNDFITYRYHSARVGGEGLNFDKDSFIQTVLGQIGYNNPLNVLAIILSVLYYRKQKMLHSPSNRLLLLLGLPLIIVVTMMSAFNTTLPHWSGPGFVTLQFIAAGWLDDKSKAGIILPRYLKYALSLIVVGLAAAFVIINFYPGTLGNKNPEELGEGDFTLDMYGWKKMGADFGNWLNEAKAKNELPGNNFIVCNKWFPAAHLDYYIARTNQMQVKGVGALNDLHQYVWLNHHGNALKNGDSAICIVPSNMPVNVEETYSKYFNSTQLLHSIPSERQHVIVRYFNIYRLNGYKENDEAHDVKIK